MYQKIYILFFFTFTLNAFSQEIIVTPAALEVTADAQDVVVRQLEVLNLGMSYKTISIDADPGLVHVNPATFTINPHQLKTVEIMLSIPQSGMQTTQIQFWQGDRKVLTTVKVSLLGNAPAPSTTLHKTFVIKQANEVQELSSPGASQVNNNPPTYSIPKTSTPQPLQKTEQAPQTKSVSAAPVNAKTAAPKKDNMTMDDPRRWEDMFKDIETSLHQYMQKVDTLEFRVDSLKDEIMVRDHTISAMRHEIRQKDEQIITLTENNQELQQGSAINFPRLPTTIPDSQVHDQLLTYERLLKESLAKAIQNNELLLEWQGNKLRVTISGDITFKTGAMDITERGKQLLAHIALMIQAHQQQPVDILVLGHTDSSPYRNRDKSPFSNWELSAMRSARVVRYLQSAGKFDGKHLRCVGNSKYAPIASNKTRQGRADNRRIELLISMAE